MLSAVAVAALFDLALTTVFGFPVNYFIAVLTGLVLAVLFFAIGFFLLNRVLGCSVRCQLQVLQLAMH